MNAHDTQLVPRTERARQQRLWEIEQALKRDPDREFRRLLTREYLDLTDPQSPKEPDL